MPGEGSGQGVERSPRPRARMATTAKQAAPARQRGAEPLGSGDADDSEGRSVAGAATAFMERL